jgi:hypothetical protein
MLTLGPREQATLVRVRAEETWGQLGAFFGLQIGLKLLINARKLMSEY